MAGQAEGTESTEEETRLSSRKKIRHNVVQERELAKQLLAVALRKR
jgi:hypothetical protein